MVPVRAPARMVRSPAPGRPWSQWRSHDVPAAQGARSKPWVRVVTGFHLRSLRGLLRHFRAFFPSFAESYRDRLLAARDFLAGAATFERSFFLFVQRALN